MKVKLLQKLLLTSGMVLFIAFQMQGQSLNEAIELYNRGIGLIDQDINAAIENLEKSYQMASNLGPEAEELREQAEIQIPGLYYDRAMGFFRQRNIPEAVSGFEKAVEVSEKFDDPATKTRSEQVLHQLYAQQANGEFREGNNEEAIRLFDKALAINPRHARSHLGKGLVYRRLEDNENFRKSMDQAIETGLAIEDEQTVSTAESTARDYFLVRGLRAKNEEKFDVALELLNASLTYDQSFPETHFVIAAVHNERGQHQNAVNSARKAIDLAGEDRETNAKMYFELGKAYEGLGNSQQACSAYSQAAFGQYEAAAKYQMEHVLKCQ